MTKKRGRASSQNINTRKLRAEAASRNRRSAKRRIQQTVGINTVVTNDMVQECILASSIDRIIGLLPKPRHRQRPSSSGGSQGKVPRSADRIPTKPMKRDVLWMTPKEQDASSTLSLTEEIRSFANYVSLDLVEENSRKNLLQDLTDAIIAKWPQAQVITFGSYPLGLSTFLSDVDVSILGMGFENESANNDVLSSANPGPDARYGARQEFDTISDMISCDDNMNESMFAGSEGGLDDSPFADSDIGETTTRHESDSDASKNGVEDGGLGGDDIEVSWEIDYGASASTGNIVAAKSPFGSADDKNDSSIALVGSDGRMEQQSAGVPTKMNSESHQKSCEKVSKSAAERDHPARDVDKEATPLQDDVVTGKKIILEADFDSNLDLPTASIPIVGSGSRARKRKAYEALDDLTEDSNGVDADVDTSNHQGNDEDDEDDEDDDGGESNSSDSDSDSESGLLSLGATKAIMKETRPSSGKSSLLNRVAQQKEEKEGAPEENMNSMLSAEEAQEVKRLRVIELLRSLFNHLKVLEWVSEIEFRHRARVPIICLTHRNGIQCDISLGLTSQDTTDMVRMMSTHPATATNDNPGTNSSDGMNPRIEDCSQDGERMLPIHIGGVCDSDSTGTSSPQTFTAPATSACAPGMRSTKGSGTPQKRAAEIKASPATYTETFYALSAFLKVFLNLLDLDKPFTGGIGSFKLYVMVAYVLQRAPATSLGEQPDLGFLLLAFFDFFGDPNNLNESTVLRIPPRMPTDQPVEAAFDRTNQIALCQKLFHRAYYILLGDIRCCEGGMRTLRWMYPKTDVSLGDGKVGDAQDTSSRHVVNVGTTGSDISRRVNTPHTSSTDAARYSRSFLGRLLDTARLHRDRSAHSACCSRYPPLTLEDRQRSADIILKELNYIACAAGTKDEKMEDLIRVNPSLACRLRSFESAEAAIRQLRQRGFAGTTAADPRYGTEVVGYGERFSVGGRAHSHEQHRGAKFQKRYEEDLPRVQRRHVYDTNEHDEYSTSFVNRGQCCDDGDDGRQYSSNSRRVEFGFRGVTGGEISKSLQSSIPNSETKKKTKSRNRGGGTKNMDVRPYRGDRRGFFEQKQQQQQGIKNGGDGNKSPAAPFTIKGFAAGTTGTFIDPKSNKKWKVAHNAGKANNSKGSGSGGVAGVNSIAGKDSNKSKKRKRKDAEKKQALVQH